MKQKQILGIKGFTLTEVLLAVMIIGLIGVALASLTRAASRESGVGRSRIMLRNNASMFIRGLRRDMEKASVVSYIQGPIASAQANTPIKLLKIVQGTKSDGTTAIEIGGWVKNSTSSQTTLKLKRSWILYCFTVGTDTSNISPKSGGETAVRGGTIYRLENTTQNIDNCTGYPNTTTRTDVLTHVKFIPSGLAITLNGQNFTYPVPLFKKNDKTGSGTNSLLDVKIITELSSNPVINDVMEETLTMPMGY